MDSLGKARKQAGYTQRQASELLGTPLSTLRRWEQGVNEPDAASIVRMADLYGVSTDYILGSGYAKPKQSETLKPDELELLDAYRSITDAGKAALLGSARGIAAQFPPESVEVPVAKDA